MSVLEHIAQRAGVFDASRRAPARLQMAAMIDVVFLLLTFFVITSSFQRSERVLPARLSAGADGAASETPTALTTVRLSVAPEGCIAALDDGTEIVIDAQKPQYGLNALGQRALQAAGAADGRGLAARLICQPDVSWQMVSAVYDVFYGLGVERISFLFEESPAGSGAASKQDQ